MGRQHQHNSSQLFAFEAESLWYAAAIEHVQISGWQEIEQLRDKSRQSNLEGTQHQTPYDPLRHQVFNVRIEGLEQASSLQKFPITQSRSLDESNRRTVTQQQTEVDRLRCQFFFLKKSALSVFQQKKQLLDIERATCCQTHDTLKNSQNAGHNLGRLALL